MKKTLCAILFLLSILNGCGETTFSRKDRLTVYMIDSPGAAVALLLNYPETKDFDTKPNIVPTLEIPMIAKEIRPRELPAEPNENGSIIYIWVPKPPPKSSTIPTGPSSPHP